MPCLLALIGFFFPRIVLILLWLSGYLGKAYATAIWPILGFFFAPFTTLAYAWAINSNGSVSGIYLVVVVLAVLMDIGVIGGGKEAKRRQALRAQNAKLK
jgi:hypothetical protein